MLTSESCVADDNFVRHQIYVFWLVGIAVKFKRGADEIQFSQWLLRTLLAVGMSQQQLYSHIVEINRHGNALPYIST